MCPEVQVLWREFEVSKSTTLRRRLVVQYLDLVRYVITKFNLSQQGRSYGLEYNDILHFGVLGLLTALDRFSAEHGVKFETYAVPRIRGSIMDELRKLDWVPRSVREGSRKAGKAAHELSQQFGREASAEEVAVRLSMTLDDYHRLLADGATATAPRSHSDSVDDAQDSSDPIDAEALSPLEHLTEEEMRGRLREAIEALSERERTVIALYYYEGLRFAEIGGVLEITESRVSQIHSDVLRRLQKTLMEFKA